MLCRQAMDAAASANQDIGPSPTGRLERPSAIVAGKTAEAESGRLAV